MQINKHYLKYSEAAEILNVSVRTLLRRCKTEEIKSAAENRRNLLQIYKPSQGTSRLKTRDLLEWIEFQI